MPTAPSHRRAKNSTDSKSLHVTASLPRTVDAHRTDLSMPMTFMHNEATNVAPAGRSSPARLRRRAPPYSAKWLDMSVLPMLGRLDCGPVSRRSARVSKDRSSLQSTKWLTRATKRPSILAHGTFLSFTLALCRRPQEEGQQLGDQSVVGRGRSRHTKRATMSTRKQLALVAASRVASSQSQSQHMWRRRHSCGAGENDE